MTNKELNMLIDIAARIVNHALSNSKYTISSIKIASKVLRPHQVIKVKQLVVNSLCNQNNEPIYMEAS